MFSKIISYFAKKPWALKFSAKWICAWSNYMQSLEWKYMKCDTALLKHYRADYKASTPFDSWHKYTLHVEYKKDAWWQLWDVISCPARIITRSNADCDDYAILAHDFFGETIYSGGNIYNFVGLYSLVWALPPYHMIAVWLGPKGEHLVVSNQSIQKFNNEKEMLDFMGQVFEDKIHHINVLNLDDNNQLYFSMLKEIK